MERGEKFEWNAILQKAFDNSKARLENHALLAHPDPAEPLAIVTDASGDGIGGALEQWDDKKGIWQPLGFYSRHLSSAEKKWPAYNQELRAIQGSLRHFRDQIEGVNSLVIYTKQTTDNVHDNGETVRQNSPQHASRDSRVHH